MLSACQNTDQLYLLSFADDLSNKDKLKLFLFMTCNANDMKLYCLLLFSFVNFKCLKL